MRSISIRLTLQYFLAILSTSPQVSHRLFIVVPPNPLSRVGKNLLKLMELCFDLQISLIEYSRRVKHPK